MFLKKASVVSIVAAATLAVSVSAVSAASAVEVANPSSTVSAGSAHTANMDSNLLADADRIQWADASRLIASKDTENGREDYLIHAATGSFNKLNLGADASDLVVNPQGNAVVFTNAVGEIWLFNLGNHGQAPVTGTGLDPFCRQGGCGVRGAVLKKQYWWGSSFACGGNKLSGKWRAVQKGRKAEKTVGDVRRDLSS